MREHTRRARHAELALRLASDDPRLLDLIAQRPHLLNPYPSLITRLAKRSRRFRRKGPADPLPNTLQRRPYRWPGRR